MGFYLSAHLPVVQTRFTPDELDEKTLQVLAHAE